MRVFLGVRASFCAVGVKMRKSTIVMAALAAATSFAPAYATSFTADQYLKASYGLNAMKQLNLIALGNATLSSDVEGKVFVGGNLTGSGPIAIGNGTKTYKADSKIRTL